LTHFYYLNTLRGNTTRFSLPICSMSLTKIKNRVVGTPKTSDFRVFFEKDGHVISPWHDIPLFADESQGIYNMVVEIPRWSNAKFEIATGLPFNPIRQDIKNGKLRFVRNCFPHHGYIWNYGAFPQTWEDPMQVHPEIRHRGDNDPLDVLEIGEQIGYTGQIKQVKVLGIMCLLDEGEVDWKVVTIDITDPLASKLHDIEDVERHMPGLIRATNEWFRIYKIPDGKPENQFAFNGETKNSSYAANVIAETNEAWKRLITGSVPAQTERYNLSVANLHVQDSPGRVAVDDAVCKTLPAGVVRGAEEPDKECMGKWFFISGNANL